MTPTRKPREGEFIALIAFSMSLVALSIDMILPALPSIASDLGAPEGNSIQQVISVLFVGLTLGQLFYGPMADRYGRRPAFAMGVVIFLAGSLVSVFADGFGAMLAGRFLQGFGAAAMRTVAMAIIRDQYKGAAMARVTSLAMSVFILVPCVAPLLGQGVLVVADWRAVFWLLLALSAGLALWFGLRQPETLNPAHRAAPGLWSVIEGMRETCADRTAFRYTIALGLVHGGFTAYLLSAEQIFHLTFHTGDMFAVWFAVLALAIGVASLVNAWLVSRFDMRVISRAAMLGAAAVSGGALAVELSIGLTLIGFVMSQALVFLCIGLMFGNMNAVAMEPLGHIAGVASSAINFISGLMGVGLGALIGGAFDLTVAPLLAGLMLTNLAALFVVRENRVQSALAT